MALRISKKLLSASRTLVSRGVVDTEAEQIVMAASGIYDRVTFFSRLKDRISERDAEKVVVHSMARAEGKILQHLTGFQDFCEHRYHVDASTLVPRPETEVLVLTAIERLSKTFPLGPTLGLEVGLGSGVISIELLLKFSGLKMCATELDRGARSLAQKNAAQILGETSRTRLKILPARKPEQVLEPLVTALQPGESADFMISNPPYLSSSDPVDEDVRAHEPFSALYAPEQDVLHFYRKFSDQAGSLLTPRGHVFLEMPSARSELIQKLFIDQNWATETVKDLAGRERVLIAWRRAVIG